MANGERSEHNPSRKVDRGTHNMREQDRSDSYYITQMMGDDSPESREAFDEMYGNHSNWDDPFQ